MFVILFMPVLIPTVIAFYLYQNLIKLRLFLKYRENFLGLIHKGSDVIWAIKDNSPSVINAVTVIKYNSTDNLQFYKDIKKRCEEEIFKTEQFPKLISIRKSYGGYHYLEKSDLTLEECVTHCTLYSSGKRDQINEILERFGNRELPRDGQSFWRITISSTSMENYCEEGFRQYVVLFQLHHGIGDGLSLLKLLYTVLDAKQFNVETDQSREITQRKVEQVQIQKARRFALLQGCLKLLFDPRVIYKLFKKHDRNILHGKKLSGEKHHAWLIDENRKTIPSMKERTRIKGVSFTGQILAGVSESLFNYFTTKNSSDGRLEKNLTILMSGLMSKHELNVLVSKSYEKLENNFTAALFPLPIILGENNCNELRENIVCGELNKLVMQKEFQLSYFLQNSYIMKFLPEVLYKIVLEQFHATMFFSNLPGPKKVRILNRGEIEDIIFWLPHRNCSGVALSIISYDGKLQYGLSVDKTLVQSKEEIQPILERIVNFNIQKINR